MPSSSAQRLLRDVSLLLGLSLLALAFAEYTTLPAQFRYRERVIHVFTDHFLTIVVPHVLIFAVLLIVFGRARARTRLRIACIYWLVTAVWLLALGGAERAFAFLLVAVYTAFLLLVGFALAGLVVEPDSRSLGLYLALGIGAVATLVPYLAWLHILRFWFLLPLFIAVAAFCIFRMRRQIGQRISSAWKDTEDQWTAGRALAIEFAVVIAAYLVVAATPPETGADAVRFYWPYIKWLERLGGFVDLPYQWSYVIPQAGVGFSATLFVLFGGAAVRWSMFLSWTALMGIGAKMLWPREDARSAENDALEPRAPERRLTGVGLAIALVVAACPVLLLSTASLATDCFVTMVTVLMAVVLIGGKRPESFVFWLVAGGLVGLTWSAKFTTIAYAAPLCLISLVRALRVAGFRRVPLYLGAGIAGVLLGAGPWFWNSYKLSDNPLFPELSNIFPSRLWPRYSGIGNLVDFHIPEGWWQKVLMPVNMTFKSGQHVEGYPGVLGLVLILLLIIAIPALRRSSWRNRGLIAAGVIGTLSLWQMTTYARYWLPGLWLVAFGLTPGAVEWIRGRRVRVVFVFAVGVVAVYQILFAMTNMWSEPDGWPWKYYRGGFTDSEYLERGFRGFAGLEKVPELNQGWPKVWFTSAGVIGQLPVLPLEAAIWEMNGHTRPSWSQRVRYLSSVGCRYWVANEEAGDEVWIRATGLARFFWDEPSRIAKSGPYGVFRMKSAQDIFGELDSKRTPGSELLADGGFETLRNGNPVFWMNYATPSIQSDALAAKEGANFAVVRSPSCWAQVVPIPKGVKKIEFSQWMKRATVDQPATGRLVVNWVNDDGNVTAVVNQPFPVGPDWTEYRAELEVPASADTASVYASAEGAGSVCVDDSHFRVVQ